jgi:hypothetical protein
MCVAVGRLLDDSQPVVERWDGSSWSIDPTPNAGGTQAILADVSCASPTACTAVGYSVVETSGIESGSSSGYATLTLVERWDGSSWSIQPSPNSAPEPGADVENSLTGVSCASATACLAIGRGFAPKDPLVEQWDGRSWSIQSSPFGPLASVSCASPTACIAIGPGGGADTNALVAHWDGGGWSVQPTPYPPDVTNGVLAAVSCWSPRACLSVGSFDLYKYAPTTLAEGWNGGSWSILTPSPRTSPDASAGGPSFTVVSCASRNACTALGGNTVMRWDGRSWSPQQFATPVINRPANRFYAVTTNLTGVSCPSRTDCAAVGSYYTVSSSGIGGASVRGPDLPLAERWNGSIWSVQRPPAPHRKTGGDLTVASCASRTACVAIGSYRNPAGHELPLVEHWGGRTWSIQSTPRPSASSSTELTDVSCASTAACIAIGSYRNRAGHQLPLVERRSASKWTIQPTANPPGATNARLTSVSCASPTTCTAVGTYKNSTGEQLTLVERWTGIG